MNDFKILKLKIIKTFYFCLGLWVLFFSINSCRSSVKPDTIFWENDGLKLIGDLYTPRQTANGAGILFLHGSLPEGRNLLLYRLICENLAERGYYVFNLDQRGYGESEDPHKIENLKDLDFVGDATHAAEFFKSELLPESVKTIIMIGHSFGGGVALVAGMRSPEVDRVVSISPGRRITARFMSNGANGLEYVQKRKSHDMDLDEFIPLELVGPMLMSYNIEQFEDSALTKPVLFIEGAKEPFEDLEFTQRFLNTLHGPVDYIRIDEATHYFGTKEILGKWFLLDKGIVTLLVDKIDSWIRTEETSGKSLTPDHRG